MTTNCTSCNSTPVPCATTPPDCNSHNCEEIVSGGCVAYTGTDIACLGITNGMSLNEIVNILSNAICTPITCTNPLDYFLTYAFKVFNTRVSLGDEITITEVINTILDAGIIMPKCNSCCPDCGVYAFGNTTDITSIQTVFGNSCCTNCGQSYSDCYTTLSAIDPAVELLFIEQYVTEYGTIQSDSGLCILTKHLQLVSTEIAVAALTAITTKTFVATCQNPFGDIFIGSKDTWATYKAIVDLGCNPPT